VNAIAIEQRKLAERLYEVIIRESNRFLHNCKHFQITVLQDSNPTYAEVAELMGKVAGLLKVVADDFDPMMHQKAHEYCELMRLMGVAIRDSNEIELSRLVSELERRPGT
jgi:hypothetical protein